MDQSRAQYSGFYFVCKYCNCVFRDKLELFCHQVNDHPEYRQEINVTNRTVQQVNHEMTYSDPRAINVEVKRPSTNFGHHSSSSSSSQQTNTSNSTNTSSWYPPTAGHVPNHIPSVPNHYYVVVPNQQSNQVINQAITVPLVNQQIAHASSTLSSSLSSCQQPQQTQQQHQQQQQQQSSSSLISQVNSSHADLVTLRNEVGNEWNKVGGGGGDDSSESDAAVNNKDEYHDYYCWKCKIKFGNAANYIAHSSSCLQRGGNQQQQQQQQQQHHDMYDSQSQSPTTYTELESQQSRKRGRKTTKQDQIQPQQQQQQQQQPQYHNLDIKRRRSNNPNYVEIDLEQEQLQQQQQQQTLHQLQTAAVLASSSFAAAGLYAVGNSSSNNNNNTKNNNSRRKNTGNVLTKGIDSSVANGSTTVLTTTERVGKPEKEKNFPCSHCGLKFSSNDRLSSHLLQCKAKKNPYETYQYKCIKCSESFDIYLQYKRHIAIHTGEVRYS